MTAKEYLKNISVLNEKIKANLKHIDDLRAKATSIGSSGNLETERVQGGSSNPDKIGYILTEIDEYERIANETIDEYVASKNEAMSMIDKLDNGLYIEILTMRYFEDATFEEIAVASGKSYRHVTRLHGYALQEFQKIVDKKLDQCV